jgi:flagellin-like hook-associated protein FlgL
MSQQLLGIANLSYNGKYLFGGTMISQPPYTTAGVYQGNDQVNHVEIDSGQVVAASQPGSQLFSKPGADVFASLSALATALQSSDSTVSDISTASVAVRAAYDQLNSARVFYGSTLDRLNSDQNFLSTEKLQLSQQMNATVGIDVNLAATDLVNAESARSATLAAAAKTDSLSLLDYLSAGSAG